MEATLLAKSGVQHLKQQQIRNILSAMPMRATQVLLWIEYLLRATHILSSKELHYRLMLLELAKHTFTPGNATNSLWSALKKPYPRHTKPDCLVITFSIADIA